MRILSWKISRAGQRGFKNQITELIKFYKLDIVILMKTKVYSNKVQSIIQTISMPNYVEIHREGFSEEFG